MKVYNKKILLSVTGMSPAVVMETLYALITERNFIPTEIRVITTKQGKNKLLTALLGVEGGIKKNEGALAEFIKDYGKKYNFSHIHFDENSIEVIKDLQGNDLPDIRTPEENQLAADQIVNLVANCCADEDSALHVSIAGGRKTMGFFLGYALSLYGREQDSLSHVLISEPFESVPNFYYPKPYPSILNDRDGKEIDAQTAKVMLAEIPWVRLELGLSDALLNARISYSGSIQKAQSMLQTPKLKFLAPMDEQKVRFGDVVIKLAPRGYSLLLAVAYLKKEEKFLDNEELLYNYYLPIYRFLKDSDDSLNKRLQFKDPKGQDLYDYLKTIQDILSESRTDIAQKVKKEFSFKKIDVPYIPKSKNKSYSLSIDADDIDIKPIMKEIEFLCLAQ